MAQYRVYDPEQEIPCPYNKCEMIRAKRMPYHLIRCRRNHPCSEYASCPLNATHVVPKPELRYHLENCPDKPRLEQDISFEAQKREGGTLFTGCTKLPTYSQIDLKIEDDWDKEIPLLPRIGVDPNIFAKMEGIQLQGLTTAEKKHMKAQYALPQEERRYFKNPDKPEEKPVAGAPKQEEEEEEELRIPNKAPQTYVPKPQSTKQQPHTVFAFSLSSTGVGRGQTASTGEQPSMEGQGVGMGRGMAGVGRGITGVGRGRAESVWLGSEKVDNSLNLIGRGQSIRGGHVMRGSAGGGQVMTGSVGRLMMAGTGRGISVDKLDKQD
ncbi:protein D7-like [Saccostrea cucullata]|uniref:protein D7-like n=1 Tax=Saccostrea cuccullata TaxID=36930 RepID=UPI002ED01746